MSNFLLKPVSLKGIGGKADSTNRILRWESEVAAHIAADGQYPDGDSSAHAAAFTYDNYGATMIVAFKDGGWEPPFYARFNRRTTLSTSPFEIGDAGERIDSQSFGESIVTLANVGAVSALSREDSYLNGEVAITTALGAIVSAPLAIPALAEATKGGYIALHGQIVRLCAAISLSADARKAAGLSGGDLTVKVLVNGKKFLLNVETDTIRVLVEQEIIVRPFFNEDVVKAQLGHEAPVMVKANTSSLFRAFRASGKDLGMDKAESEVSDEHGVFTVLFAGTRGLSVSRLRTKYGITTDTRDWPLKLVPNCETLGGGTAWQVIDGRILAAMEPSLDDVTIGLTDSRGEGFTSPPVLFWTESGICVAAPGMGLNESQS